MLRARRRIIFVLVAALMTGSCAADGTSAPLTGNVEDLAAVRLRNFNIGKTLNKSVGDASKAIQGGANSVGGAFEAAFAEANNESSKAGRTAMSSVISTAEHEWRNASGQIIDGAGTLVSAITLTWPASLGSAIEGQIVQAARSEIDAGLAELARIGDSLGALPADQAEDRINAALNPRRVNMPSVSLPGVGQAYVPAKNPLYVHIRQSQWESSNAANLMIDVDFFGLKRYRVGVGCIGFPNGFHAAPRVALNGGCDNPWDIRAAANQVASTAQNLVTDIGREIGALGDQMLGLVKAAAGGADNPRMVPAVLIDLLLNRFLAMCCSLSFEASEAANTSKLTTAAQDGQAEFAGASDPAVLEILNAVSGTSSADVMASIEQKALMAFGVPQLQGIDFSLPADLSIIAEVSQAWGADGTVQITIELGLFGLFVASVGLGCITFGTSWSQAPSFTFNGGCDNSWNVSFNGGGYTSAPHRLDHRLENGTDAAPAVAPEVPAPSPVASPGQWATGGTITEVVQGGVRYRVHTFTFDSESTFVVPPEMEGVPVSYLVIAGGGSGSSNRTQNKTGSGGGGGGGIVTNIRTNPVYLTAGTYDVIVGAGGTADYNEGDGVNGGNSSINGLGVVAIGGGGGGRMDDGGRNGGSGGGAGFRKGADDPGAPVPGQGNVGGRGHNGCSGNKCSAGGGGGGAGSAGGDAWKNNGGAGGAGVQYSFDGVQRFYGAGGGGGGNAGNIGGSGVGGDGGRQRAHGGDATPNSGSGGGGAGGGSNDRLRGGNGAAGIVFIRYPVTG